MEGRLFGGPAERKRREEIGVRALLHCQQERQRLRKCFKETWLGWCSEEQSAFWECFNKVREGGEGGGGS